MVVNRTLHNFLRGRHYGSLLIAHPQRAYTCAHLPRHREAGYMVCAVTMRRSRRSGMYLISEFSIDLVTELHKILMQAVDAFEHFVAREICFHQAPAKAVAFGFRIAFIEHGDQVV